MQISDLRKLRGVLNLHGECGAGHQNLGFFSLFPSSREARHAAINLLRAAFRDAAPEDNLVSPYPCHVGALPEVHSAEPRYLPEP